MTAPPAGRTGAPTVETLLAQARDSGVDRLDAHVLVARMLGVPRTWVMAHGDATLDDDVAAEVRSAFAKRAAGVPLSYLVGEREFHGLSLAVTPAVLDPRPDTETLVDWALELIGAQRWRVVDLGTGSGAIALAVKHARPQASVVATDRHEDALAVAGANARRLGLDVTFAAGDWWAAVPGQRFHLALSNPPYVADGDPHLDALRHEPRHALTPGARGLEAIERIVAGAADHLRPGGWLLLEHGHDQAAAVTERLHDAGFSHIDTRQDLAGQPRCSGGRRGR